MPPQTEFTAIEAARRLGVGLDYLYTLLWTGKLPGRKKDNRWYVSAKAVEIRLKARQERETEQASA